MPLLARSRASDRLGVEHHPYRSQVTIAKYVVVKVRIYSTEPDAV